MNKREGFQEIAAELSEALAGISESSLEDILDHILSADRIFIIGAGRTLLMMRAFAMSLMQIGLKSYVVGDTITPAITCADLLIAASCSGKTKSVNLLVKEAANIGAKVILYTAHPESPMGRVVHYTVVIHSASDKGNDQKFLQFESNGFEHALVPLNDAIIMFLCERTGANESTMLNNHANLE